MKKKLTVLLTTSMVTLSSVIVPLTSVSAENIDSKIESAQKKVDTLKGQISETEKELATITADIAKVESESADIQQAISDAQTKLQTLQSEIATLEELIAKRNDRLAEQARAEQTENNLVNYIGIVLNSTSIVDAIERISAIADLVSAGKEMLDQQVSDKAAVEAKRQEVEQTLTQQGERAQKLSEMQDELSVKKTNREVYAKSLAAEKASTEEERSKLLSEKEAIQRQLEEQRKAEIARQEALKKEAEAVAKMRAAAAKATPVAYTANSQQSVPNTTMVTASPVQTTAPAVTPAPTGSKQQGIVSAALAQIGVGQDCTRLVSNALRAVGINYHGWPAGYMSLGTVVPASQAQPGDLIYYANGGMGLAHIAVYIGNGQAVHGGFNGGQTVVATAYLGSGPVFIRVR